MCVGLCVLLCFGVLVCVLVCVCTVVLACFGVLWYVGGVCWWVLVCGVLVGVGMWKICVGVGG